MSISLRTPDVICDCAPTGCVSPAVLWAAPLQQVMCISKQWYASYLANMITDHGVHMCIADAPAGSTVCCAWRELVSPPSVLRMVDQGARDNEITIMMERCSGTTMRRLIDLLRS